LRDQRVLDELVQPVQVDVGKQWAGDPALRCAAGGRITAPLFAVSSPEQTGYQSEEAVVVDLLAEDRQQDLMVDVVEVE
jgi:hypothetical protein